MSGLDFFMPFGRPAQKVGPANFGLSAVNQVTPMDRRAWDDYEQLPAPIRHALQQANGAWSVGNVRRAFGEVDAIAYRGGLDRRVVVDLYVNAFETQQAGEIDLTSKLSMTRHGYPLPHVAAGATVLRDSCLICEECRKLPLSAPGRTARRRPGVSQKVSYGKNGGGDACYCCRRQIERD